MSTQSILDEVAQERRRQNSKWGPIQDIPLGTGPCTPDAYDFYRPMLDQARHENDDGDATFATVLAEEFAEAMLEDDPEKLRAELIQVAAVAVKTIEHIDRGRT